MPEPVALASCDSYDNPSLRHKVFDVLNVAGLGISPGQRILVKPNLLMAHELACTNPLVVAAVCEWLVAHGAKVTVADSPAFGTCESVARAIGLTELLKPMGLAPVSFGKGCDIGLDVEGRPRLRVAVEAMESDKILSVAKVKAHSQMRITLAVKNCYGCIMGVRKAMAHARFGKDVAYFADCVAALWAALPPVAGFCDGITAMNITGPRLGQPYALNLLGASRSAPALDAVLMDILAIPSAPLSDALQRRQIPVSACFPLEQPGNFSSSGFIAPEKLKEISFSPLVLLRSLWRRFTTH